VHTPRHAPEDLADEDVHVEVSSRVAELIKDNAILQKVRTFLKKCECVLLTL
jgi:hypothetical protein